MNLWRIMKTQIKKAIQNLASVDSGDYQTTQVSFLGSTQDVRQLIPYGLYSSSPIDSEWVIFNLRCNPDDKVGIGTDYENRFKGTDNNGLKEGEVCIYNQKTGNYIFFNSENNTIEYVKGTKNVQIDEDLNITVTQNVVNDIDGNKTNTIDGDMTNTIGGDKTNAVTGDYDTTAVNVSITGSTTVSLSAPSVSISGNTLVTGTLESTGVLTAGNGTTGTFTNSVTVLDGIVTSGT